MKTIKVLLIIFLTCFSPFSHAQSCNSIRSIQWLLGDWTADDGENIITESWNEVSLVTFEGLGESRSKKSNELHTSESLRLIEMASEIFYLAKVDHNDLPVAFKLTQCSSKSAVFENSTHDFPKKTGISTGY